MKVFSNPKIQKIINQYIADKASIFLVVLDKNGIIKAQNQYADKILGKQYTGQNFKKLFVDFTIDKTLDDLINNTKESEKLMHLDGNTRMPQTLYFKFYRFKDIILVLGKHRWSEYERLREELVSVNNELGNLTRELNKKNQELDKLNQLKNQFLGMAAHDLRKPVGKILNFAEFLEEEIETKLNQDQKKYLEIIISSTDYMKNIINDFLDISLIESGHFPIKKRSYKIDKVIYKSIEDNALYAKKKDIDLIYKNNLDNLQFKFDPDKIIQVLNNLISNAIDFSHGGEKVVIKLKKNSDQVVIAVKDNGKGISAKDKKALFKPFSSKKNLKSSGTRSIGLGLAITKKIVES
ncbi:MAG: HAMP domain-containing histidine kinase, partial [Candidatus Marinimicrobia bacterium]|nr:HAMP domain-containing histidine kinase [Candidatus Neomarinimicrobiota bacterium]